MYKRNYVMAGVRYGIGQSTYDPWAERGNRPNNSGAIQTTAMHDKPEIVTGGGLDTEKVTYTVIGAGVGFLVSKNPIGALIGAGIGYFLPRISSIMESHEEPMPESPAREDSF